MQTSLTCSQASAVWRRKTGENLQRELAGAALKCLCWKERPWKMAFDDTVRGEKREREIGREREKCEKERAFTNSSSLSLPCTLSQRVCGRSHLGGDDEKGQALQARIPSARWRGSGDRRCVRSLPKTTDDYHLPAVCKNIKELLGFEAKKTVGTGMKK